LLKERLTAIKDQAYADVFKRIWTRLTDLDHPRSVLLPQSGNKFCKMLMIPAGPAMTDKIGPMPESPRPTTGQASRTTSPSISNRVTSVKRRPLKESRRFPCNLCQYPAVPIKESTSTSWGH
jgi:hypothetical protein